jgi:hypothetical protein
MCKPQIQNQAIINAALQSTSTSRHGAAALYRGTPIAYGYNHVDSRHNSVHAEQAAVYSALNKLHIPFDKRLLKQYTETGGLRNKQYNTKTVSKNDEKYYNNGNPLSYSRQYFFNVPTLRTMCQYFKSVRN